MNKYLLFFIEVISKQYDLILGISVIVVGVNLLPLMELANQGNKGLAWIILFLAISMSSKLLYEVFKKKED